MAQYVVLVRINAEGWSWLVLFSFFLGEVSLQNRKWYNGGAFWSRILYTGRKGFQGFVYLSRRQCIGIAILPPFSIFHSKLYE